MQISKILYSNNINTRVISFKSKQKQEEIEANNKITSLATQPTLADLVITRNQTSPIGVQTQANSTTSDEEFSKRFSETLKQNYFKLPEEASPDKFQIEAGKALLKNDNVLVEAPTGTGKTAVAHYAVSKNMAEGKTTFYTTPIKALSNQKLNEFRAIYGDDNVGILTGDRRENPEAPVVIMTTEVYRNMALSNMYGEQNPLFDKLGTVIFDEFHYLGDDSRGPVWEESAMFTPKNVQMLALSATIGNPRELTSWLGNSSTNKTDLVSIPEEARHVPLTFDNILTGSYIKEDKRIQKSIKKKGIAPDESTEIFLTKPALSDFKFAVNKLEKKQQLPAIFFIFSKAYSREVLDYFANEGIDLTTKEEKNQIARIVSEHKAKGYIGSDLDTVALMKGYAIHNAGIIPAQKELIEELFQKKLIKTVLATETLAAGINMPAKTVVITSPYKPTDTDGSDDDGIRSLTANEFKQMSGRAGRRGIDSVGYVYTMPTDKMSEREFDDLVISHSDSIRSSYSPDYSFLAEFYENDGKITDLSYLYDRTFKVHNSDDKQELEKLMETSKRRTNLMKQRGFLTQTNSNIELTTKGHMASKVKGYDALLLAEMVASKQLEGASPAALTMLAASIANEPSPNEPVILSESSEVLSPIVSSFQQTVDSVYNNLYTTTNKTLARLGKSIESFGSYEEMVDFAKSLEQPDVEKEEINTQYFRLKELVKELSTIQTGDGMSAEELAKRIQNGQTVPSKALRHVAEQIDNFKKRMGNQTIQDYIDKKNLELQELDEGKGNKAKILAGKRKEKLEGEIKEATLYQFLDSVVDNEIAKNYRFMQEHKDLKKDFKAVEELYARANSNEKLLKQVLGLQSIDEFQFSNSLSQLLLNDLGKTSNMFASALEERAAIGADEVAKGLPTKELKLNRNVSVAAYTWGMLNEVNSDGLSNWKQLLRLNPNTEEGVLYREMLQTADLLSQIGEMAEEGIKHSKSREDFEYYKKLLETAYQARQSLIREPVTV